MKDDRPYIIGFGRSQLTVKNVTDALAVPSMLVSPISWRLNVTNALSARNKERTNYLESQGYKVIRFWNNDIMNNIEGVILAIMYALEQPL